MINKLILALTLCLAPLFVAAQDQSFDDFIDVELAVSDISMTADGMVITYEGHRREIWASARDPQHGRHQ